VKGPLPVELPALVRVLGLVEGAQLALVTLAQLLDAVEGGMGAQVTGQARAAEPVVGELEFQVGLKLGQRAIGLLIEQADGVPDPSRRARPPRRTAVGAHLRQQALVTLLAVCLESTIQGAFGDGLGVFPVRPLNGLVRTLAHGCASLALIEAGIDEGECAHDALPEDIKLMRTLGLGPVVVIE